MFTKFKSSKKCKSSKKAGASSSSSVSPPVENFLKQFRIENADTFEKFTATQFLDVWMHYDRDG